MTAPAVAGPEHHGTDPAAGCNGNATWIASRDIHATQGGAYLTTVDFYYSYSCQTNWLRVRGNPSGAWAEKHLNSDGMAWIAPEIDYGSGASHSMQAYAPGATCINFAVYLLTDSIDLVGKVEGRIC